MNTLYPPPGLLVLDVQNGFDDPYWGERNNHKAEKNILELQAAWREKSWPVLHSQHLSMNISSPFHYTKKKGIAFKEATRPMPGEYVFQKQVNSAFIGTQLEAVLNDLGVKTVVITGLSTQHCVSTTTRMSANLGFTTYLAEDACAAFAITDHKGTFYSADAVHQAQLAALHKEFATIVSTQEMLQLIEKLKTE
ncbi:isochorismatase family protein [Bacillus lacus]|uniref:Isochorismatase family protein n=1 Tax=Metabacillus lacus TaxID=1983721 RepID=A0A7X2M0T0_9BACI|nr:cysteine hydrolase family protein [Metabacillus lacus]MRX73204.1 isochorismatase family protein [Metabacillus lacus]